MTQQPLTSRSDRTTFSATPPLRTPSSEASTLIGPWKDLQGKFREAKGRCKGPSKLGHKEIRQVTYCGPREAEVVLLSDVLHQQQMRSRDMQGPFSRDLFLLFSGGKAR
jgi:hypothetical protein